MIHPYQLTTHSNRHHVRNTLIKDMAMSASTPNRLIHEKSPYLQQHAFNPVDWHPWGPEALSRARAENKPILLSIGCSTGHWCHVMENESFTDQTIAALMNRHVVCIKVDREERPDLDKIYITAVSATIGSADLGTLLTDTITRSAEG